MTDVEIITAYRAALVEKYGMEIGTAFKMQRIGSAVPGGGLIEGAFLYVRSEIRTSTTEPVLFDLPEALQVTRVWALAEIGKLRTPQVSAYRVWRDHGSAPLDASAPPNIYLELIRTRDSLDFRDEYLGHMQTEPPHPDYQRRRQGGR